MRLHKLVSHLLLLGLVVFGFAGLHLASEALDQVFELGVFLLYLPEVVCVVPLTEMHLLLDLSGYGTGVVFYRLAAD